MQCFERSYKKIQDVISQIGGVAQGITYVAVFLNCLFNEYVTISNIEKIIFPYLKPDNSKKKENIKRTFDKLQKNENKFVNDNNFNHKIEINYQTSDSKETSTVEEIRNLAIHFDELQDKVQVPSHCEEMVKDLKQMANAQIWKLKTVNI